MAGEPRLGQTWAIRFASRCVTGPPGPPGWPANPDWARLGPYVLRHGASRAPRGLLDGRRTPLGPDLGHTFCVTVRHGPPGASWMAGEPRLGQTWAIRFASRCVT